MTYTGWAAGQRVTGGELTDMVTPPVSYTPVWGGVSALGASTSAGRAYQAGGVMHVIASLTWGTGSSLGTGTITVSLPAAASAVPGGDLGWQGTGRYNPGGGVAWKSLVPYVQPGSVTAIVFAVRQTDVSWVSPGTAGYAWVSGSAMRVQFSYELA